jgi:hypothetical protein
MELFMIKTGFYEKYAPGSGDLTLAVIAPGSASSPQNQRSSANSHAESMRCRIAESLH